MNTLKTLIEDEKKKVGDIVKEYGLCCDCEANGYKSGISKGISVATKLIEEINILKEEKANCGNCSFMAQKIREEKNKLIEDEIKFLDNVDESSVWYQIENRIKELKKMLEEMK